MDDTTSAGLSAGPRRPNARGQGERLREEIISAAVQMLGDLADDEALSLRAVARAVSISPTSVYLYFPDRDALVAAAMERCHAEMLQAADEAEAAHQDPALGLRARILAQAAWVQEHPGLYKVMHESKVGMPFKEAAVHAHYGCGAALHGRWGCRARGRRHRRTRSPDGRHRHAVSADQ